MFLIKYLIGLVDKCLPIVQKKPTQQPKKKKAEQAEVHLEAFFSNFFSHYFFSR